MVQKLPIDSPTGVSKRSNQTYDSHAHRKTPRM